MMEFDRVVTLIAYAATAASLLVVAAAFVQYFRLPRLRLEQSVGSPDLDKWSAAVARAIETQDSLIAKIADAIREMATSSTRLYQTERFYDPRSSIVRAEMELAIANFQAGNREPAVGRLDSIVAFAQTIEIPQVRAEAFVQLATVFRQIGQTERAVQAASMALDILRKEAARG